MIQLEFNHSLPSTLRDGSDPPVFAAEGQAGLGFSCLAAVQGRWRLAKPASKVPSFVYNNTGLLEHLLSRVFYALGLSVTLQLLSPVIVICCFSVHGWFVLLLRLN